MTKYFHISKADSFKTAEAGKDDRLLGSWKLDIALSAVFNVNYFLFGTVKVVWKLLIFLAFLPEDSHFFLHHITDWCLVISGKGLRGPTKKNGSQNWIATNKGPLKSTERSLVLINVFHKEAWKGTRSIVYVVLLTCACTKNWFLEYIRTIT